MMETALQHCTLVEAVSVMMNKGAASASEFVLLDDSDLEPGLRESRRRSNSSHAGACLVSLKFLGLVAL